MKLLADGRPPHRGCSKPPPYGTHWTKPFSLSANTTLHGHPFLCVRPSDRKQAVTVIAKMSKARGGGYELLP